MVAEHVRRVYCLRVIHGPFGKGRLCPIPVPIRNKCSLFQVAHIKTTSWLVMEAFLTS